MLVRTAKNMINEMADLRSPPDIRPPPSRVGIDLLFSMMITPRSGGRYIDGISAWRDDGRELINTKNYVQQRPIKYFNVRINTSR
jgi:hypothetical protein